MKLSDELKFLQAGGPGSDRRPGGLSAEDRLTQAKQHLKDAGYEYFADRTNQGYSLKPKVSHLGLPVNKPMDPELHSKLSSLADKVVSRPGQAGPYGPGVATHRYHFYD